MEIIFERDTLRGIIGINEDIITEGDNNLKLSRFCVIRKVKGEGILVYNTLVESMVLLTEDEYKNVKTYNSKLMYLYNNFFLIKDDEYIESLSDRIQEYIRTHKPRHDYNKLSTVTILPSTGCNAKCFYCFEKGSVKKHMDYDTADNVVKYIIQHYNGIMLRIRWFGGEPLINEKIITYISEKLIDNGINFQSNLTSNCFLIKKENISLYKNAWKLQKVSVTIDGTENVYNNVKSFTYNGSAYDKVLNNIEYLSNGGIRVSIRINIGIHNLDDVEKLVNELLIKFKEHKNVTIYLNRLYDNCDGAPINEEELSKVYKKVIEMTTFLRKNKKGGGSRIRINKPFKAYSCMSDSGKAVIIFPDGKLGLCEHYMDEYYIGDINNGVTNMENVNVCCRQVDKHEVCFKCVLYPTCTRLKICTGGVFCHGESADYVIYNTKRSMLSEYNKYKKEKING